MNWYTKVLKQYFDFNGRARRKEFWMFMLISTVVSIILSVIDKGLGTSNEATHYSLLTGIYSLLVLIPTIAVSVRRLHDTDHSAWWILLNIIPIIGSLILLVVFCFDSKEDNEYGPNPKRVADF